MSRAVIGAAVALSIGALAGASTPAEAQPRRVAVAPLSTLGVEARSADTKPAQAHLEAGLHGVPETEIVGSEALAAAIRKARRADLRGCDGGAACLAELGALVGAGAVVHGELGGLGEVKVVYLKLVDVADGRELRSTTLELSADGTAADAARAAAYRLLAPERYTGQLALEIDVAGAAIYIDGRRVATSPATALSLPAGTHALRITHPEFHDFVRFVEVEFDRTETIAADLQRFPIVGRGVERRGDAAAVVVAGGAEGGFEPAPWYRRWYVIAGASAVVFVGSAVLAGALAGGIDSDREKIVGQ
jgi:hypothetical protein